jgi:hypothetical protein
MRERHRYSREIPELHVNRFHAAENGDDDEDDDEEEEERRHDEEEEEEEEEPVWTASGVLIDTTRFLRLAEQLQLEWRLPVCGRRRRSGQRAPSQWSAHGGNDPSLPRITQIQ